jgi:hypothetical protein
MTDTTKRYALATDRTDEVVDTETGLRLGFLFDEDAQTAVDVFNGDAEPNEFFGSKDAESFPWSTEDEIVDQRIDADERDSRRLFAIGMANLLGIPVPPHAQEWADKFEGTQSPDVAS